LHDKEIRVVYVKLHRLEEVLHSVLLRAMAIDHVFAGSVQHNLPRHRDGCVILEADGAGFLVAIVEHDGDTGFGDSSLTLFVY
jgi:hypothetical protein